MADGKRAYVKFYKDGDSMGLSTNCLDEDEFWGLVAAELDAMITDGRFMGDWEFQLERWLPCMFEIVARIRGYKSTVVEQRVLYSGSTFESDVVAVMRGSEAAVSVVPA